MLTADDPALPQKESTTILKGVAAAVLAALIMATLHLGREVFVPIALAILLSFALAPLARGLQNWRFPRVISVIAVVALAFLVIFAIGGVIAAQMTQLASDLPRYESNMRAKIASLRGTASTNGTLERAADVLTDLGKELNKPKDAPVGSAAPGTGDVKAPDAKPIPVEVRQPPPTALESIAALLAPLLSPLMTTGIVFIFVIFTLLHREDLRNRLIKLAGSHDLQKTTMALDDAARRISKLFLSQLALNSGFAVLIGTGLWLIGIPSAILWGILAGVLRFVPYVGAFISAVFPLVLAVAVDPGWSLMLWTAALFFVVEPVAAHVLEPLIYGRSTGLSPLAVVVSATLWTALWGPIGLVLATPLTICLVVMGRHVESLKFLDVMFGDRPALSPPEVFYQRMLAGDPAEALDKAEEFLNDKPLSAYYDEVALNGLELAQMDMERGTLDGPHLQRVRDAVIELVGELAEHDDKSPKEDNKKAAGTEAAVDLAGPAATLDLPVLAKDEMSPEWHTEAPVLCVAGRSGLDEAAAAMLAQILARHGVGARVEGPDALTTANIFHLEGKGAVLVCVSFLDTANIAHMRYAIRRLRRRLSGARILLGCWGAEVDLAKLAEAVKADGAVATLRSAVKFCLAQARSETMTEPPGGPITAAPLAVAG
jgi:predicted PurR-regulated permease PerM